jgi:hypothetical protein
MEKEIKGEDRIREAIKKLEALKEEKKSFYAFEKGFVEIWDELGKEVMEGILEGKKKAQQEEKRRWEGKK